MVIDEMPRLGKLDQVINAPALMRGNRGNVLMIAQDYDQIKEVYGPTGPGKVNGTVAYRIILAQNNFDSAESISKHIGDATRKKESVSTSAGQLMGTVSTSTEGFKLASSQFLMSMKEEDCIVISQNYASRPIFGQQVRWYKDKIMKKLAGEYKPVIDVKKSIEPEKAQDPRIDKEQIIMKLWLCEKPSQAKAVAARIGVVGRGDGFIDTKDGKVTWCFGHMLGIKSPGDHNEKCKTQSIEALPIIPNHFEQSVSDDKIKQTKIIGKLLKESDHVVIATDGDREGELLGREILDYFNWSGNIERMWNRSIDDESIDKALKEIFSGSKTESLYIAGQARAESDYICSMTSSLIHILLC